jgi:hypothetical protein
MILVRVGASKSRRRVPRSRRVPPLSIAGKNPSARRTMRRLTMKSTATNGAKPHVEGSRHSENAGSLLAGPHPEV